MPYERLYIFQLCASMARDLIVCFYIWHCYFFLSVCVYLILQVTQCITAIYRSHACQT
ncbi:hypothetical protein BJV82DRAFT_637424 [Fennellomyces sp. T-0311]|nr:hypothetical protein BJV82DRAFT_637424 [Fennellomyces sp. T-0311]